MASKGTIEERLLQLRQERKDKASGDTEQNKVKTSDSSAAPVGRQRGQRGGSKGSISGTAASTDAMANFDITKECVIAKEEEWQLLFGNR